MITPQHDTRALQDKGQHEGQSAGALSILDSLRCLDGGWSCMRIVTMLTSVVVLGMWVWACFWEGRFVALDWPMVTLLVGSQTAKAGQMFFERGLGPRDFGGD